MKKRINFENYWGKKLKENSSPTDNSWQLLNRREITVFRQLKL